MFEMKIVWYDVSEKLPETSGEVLVNSCFDYIQSVNYSAKYQKFNCYDSDKAERVEEKEIKPKRWAYAPKFDDVSDTTREVLNNG